MCRYGWQLYKDDGAKDYISFRRSIAQEWLESYKKNTKRGVAHASANFHDHSRIDTIDHMIVNHENQKKLFSVIKSITFLIGNVTRPASQTIKRLYQ